MNSLPLKTLFKSIILIAISVLFQQTVHSQIDFEVLNGDAQICLGDSTLLRIDANVDSVNWSPTSGVSMPMSLSTFVSPSMSTTYFATLYAGEQTQVVRFQVDIISAPVLGNDVVVCSNGGMLMYDLSTLAFPGDYSLSSAANFTIVETSPNVFSVNINGVNPGTYTLTATNPDCNQSDEITVTVAPGDAAVLDLQESDITICQGTEVDLSVATTPGQSYEWFANGTPVSSSNQLTDTPTVTTTYVIAASGGSCLIPATDSITVTVNNDPAISLPEMVDGCENDILQLGNNIAQAGTTYSWEPTENILDPTAINAELLVIEDGTYILTANNGCEIKDTIEVNLIDNDLDIPMDTLFLCKGGSIVIPWTTNPQNDDVTWTTLDGAPLFNVPSPFEVSPDDVVTYIGTVENNGCTFSDTITIQVDSLPGNLEIAYSEYNMAPAPICVGDTVQILTIPIYDNVFYPDLTFQWFSGGTVGAPGQDNEFLTPDSLPQVIFIAEETRIYSRINENGACLDTSHVEVPVVPILEVDVTPLDPVCPNSTLTITGEAFDPINMMDVPADEVNWEWMVDSGTIDPAEGMGENTPTVMVGSSAVNIMLTATYEGCPVMEQFQLPVFSTPALGFPETLVCPGDMVQLNSGFVGPNYVFEWSSTNNDLGTQVNSSNPQVTINTTTTYSVTVTNGDCDPVMDEVTIMVFDAAAGNLGTSTETVCDGDSFMASIPSDYNGGPNPEYTWKVNGVEVQAGLDFSSSFSENTQIVACVSNDCMDNQVVRTINVAVVNTPNSDIEVKTEPNGENLYGEGGMIELCVQNPVNGVEYTWGSDLGAEFSNLNSVSTLYTVPDSENGSDVIYLTADDNGCVSTSSFPLSIDDASVELPNIFTPGLQENRVFKLRVNGIVDIIDLVIYDRWGNKVYDNDNAEQEWDGNINGEPAPSEVYIYTVTYQIPGQDPKTESKDLTLLR